MRRLPPGGPGGLQSTKREGEKYRPELCFNTLLLTGHYLKTESEIQDGLSLILAYRGGEKYLCDADPTTYPLPSLKPVKPPFPSFAKSG